MSNSGEDPTGDGTKEDDLQSRASESEGCSSAAGDDNTVLKYEDLEPTKTFNIIWLRVRAEEYHNDIDIYGKWLVFKDFDQLGETWRMIKAAVLAKNLGGCLTAKCSTMSYSPSEAGPGPSTAGVVCVYTEEHNMDNVGFALIELVQQDIRYKTDDATYAYQYVHAGSGKTTIKTIFWNNGEPSFERTGPLCHGTTPNKEDIWHINIVNGPEVMCSEEENGRWILTLKFFQSLTTFWHLLKPKVKSGELSVMKMECPAKKCPTSPHEKPVFLFYTSCKHRDEVGRVIIRLVRRDIKYEQKLANGTIRFDTLHWNDGEPVYGSDHELTDEEYSGDPTKVCDSPWISVGSEVSTDDIFGKWLVFCDYRHLDETWKTIKAAIESDSLQGCVSAKCSTMYYNPTEAGVGPKTEGVIYVYTEEHNVDDIGFKLVELVRQDIRYKTEIGFKSSHRITLDKTIFWNYGKPSFLCDSRCFSRNKTDIWHVNVVRGPEPVCHEEDDGRWILTVERQHLTELWHILKQKVESEGFGAIEMKCPAKKHRDSLHEKPVFHIYTSYKHQDDVGEELIGVTRRDIEFEHRNGRVRYETLYWNDGKPAYKKMKIVRGTVPTYFEKDQGRWIINLEHEELWDQLKRDIKSEDFGAIQMGRPADVGPNFPLKRPVLYICTSYKHKDKVGEKLIKAVQRDIEYQHKKSVNGRVRFDTLYWNNGEPAYETINRKGITKNWRDHS